MGDLFHENVKEEWLRRIIFEMMRSPNKHTFLILTKRPKRMAEFINWYGQNAIWGGPRPGFLNDFPRIWLGVSVENQRTADERIPILLQIPAAKRFVSVEPMLQPINVMPYLLPKLKFNPLKVESVRLDWVICGAETGPKARPMDRNWARSLKDQCKAAGVPFFFKQMSAKQPIPRDLMIREFPK
jgi:protein gp37